MALKLANIQDDTEQYASLLEKYNEALGNILGKDLCLVSDILDM